MSVEDLIKRDIETLEPGSSCAEAARMMRDRGVGSIVISEQGRPLGIVTDRDLVLRVMATDQGPEQTTVGEIMSPMPVFASRNRSIEEVLEAMRNQAVRRIPIVDEHQKLIGMVSLDDVILFLSERLSSVGATIRKEM